MLGNIISIASRRRGVKRTLRVIVTWTKRGVHNMSVKTAAFGSWSSPISSKIVTESSVQLLEVRTDVKNPSDVYWTEMRYDEGGRYVICKQTTGQDGQSLAITPDQFSARTLVHEYGGGAFFVNDGKVYFSNFKDQRLYVQKSEAGSTPVPISPEDSGWRYADGELNEKTGKIFCVREDHKSGTKEPVNTVISLDLSTQKQIDLVKGADFYSHPRVSPNGKTLAWVQWNHPNMPWDTTELWIADLNEACDGISGAKKVAGGDDCSVIEPGWMPDNSLLYISDKSEWWNLYQMTPDGQHTNLLPQDRETGGPHWAFNCTTYSVNPSGNGQVALKMGGDLGIFDLKTKAYKMIDTGFASFRFINMTINGDIFCYGGSSTRFPCVIHVQPGKVDVIKESKVLSIDKEYYSIPEAITWPTSKGDNSHGYLYLPQNKDYTGTPDTLPPLLVKAHGGPTAQTGNNLDLKIQYFTSRGFAVLDVNYRGSTGYGRTYRMKLRKNWGVLDMDDCCMGAQFLADSKKVDPEKLCIDGGSAGGYTTLACLTFRKTFKAGASHYGICDLEALAEDTHKFESRYLDSLIAPYSGKENIKIYKQRSPINYVDDIQCPMAFFQGDEDKIVPPNQAQKMFEAVKNKGLPTMFVLFEGEQHGFRKSENLQTALDGELYFFSKVFGFEATGITCDKIIHNL